MKTESRSLRAQFLIRTFITLMIIVMIAGTVQFFYIKQQVAKDVQRKSLILSESVEQGIAETKSASTSIEHQIDLRLLSYATRISYRLGDQPLSSITNEELKSISKELGVTGITLFGKKKNDIVGVKATDPSEIGFSFKKIGYPDGYRDLNSLYYNRKVARQTHPTYNSKIMYALPISQSGSHGNKPTFFKYAYYHAPGTDYIINPYIEANEVYQFTNKVGPNTLINKMEEKFPFVKEIGVLEPTVFKNPELAKKLYPPLKKVAYGKYTYKDSKDKQIMLDILKGKKSMTEYIKSYGHEKVYKMFIPTKDGQVIYIALDYSQLSKSLSRSSIILIVSGIASLLALFFITARFFNEIYVKIRLIIDQIKRLESRDLTAKSNIYGVSELTELSEGLNSMVDSWNESVRHTKQQADKTQKLSVLLEAEASNSVEKMFEMSTESTMKSREQLYEINEFLDDLKEILTVYNFKEKEKTLEKIEEMKIVANDRTYATTNMTIALSDLIKSLQGQSAELSEISNALLKSMDKFKL